MKWAHVDYKISSGSSHARGPQNLIKTFLKMTHVKKSSFASKALIIFNEKEGEIVIITLIKMIKTEKSATWSTYKQINLKIARRKILLQGKSISIFTSNSCDGT